MPKSDIDMIGGFKRGKQSSANAAENIDPAQFSSNMNIQDSHGSYDSRLEDIDYSKVIIPVNIGVKYNPPKLGIEYYVQNDDSFNKSLDSRKQSMDSMIVNDLAQFEKKLLVHEIYLDALFFDAVNKDDQGGEFGSSRYNARQRLFGRKLPKINAGQILQQIYNDKRNAPFLNNKILKSNQIERLVQKMVDRFLSGNMRSPSRGERSGSSKREN